MGTTIPIIAGFLLKSFISTAYADEASRAANAGGDFFEKRIRPVLAAHCWKCHGPKNQEAGLRLDSRAAVMKGSDTGKVVIVGKPEKSRLTEVLTHTGEIKMPPSRKLPKPARDAFAVWIKQGLAWPESPSVQASSSDAAVLKSHWAFQPVKRPELPRVRDRNWPRTPVDNFILAKLQSADLSPSPEADKRTLLRRVTFDLTGLPPTPEESKAFLADDSPNAYEKLVDRLLASPRYGERWARHWLDVARYADNKGYVFFEEKTFPWAYTYRDYVIRAFNRDLPFDRFVLEQLAADRLELGEDKRPLTAMGFLTLGGRFMNNSHDVIDDRIDVVTRGLMGVTVTCARCHDHKFDPISQAEYYALYGVFRSSVEPVLPPTFRPLPENDETRKFTAEMSKRLKALNDFVTRKRNALIADGRKRVAEYLMEAYAKRNQPPTDDFMLLIPAGGLNPTLVERWQKHLARAKRDDGDAVWTIWHWYAAIADDDLKQRISEVNQRIAAIDASKTQLNPLVVRAFQQKPPKTMKDVAALYAKLLRSVKPDETAKTQAARQLSRHMYGADAPPVVPRLLGYGFLSLLPDRKAQGEYKKLLKAVEQWSMKGPAAPPRAMVLRDARRPYHPRLFLRGNPSRPGKPVSRAVPRVINREAPLLKNGSGRLELAKAIIDPNNPLTARVLVNRVWRHHFGAGLVTTPSDFGTRSEPPSHPQLLDWLASEFVGRRPEVGDQRSEIRAQRSDVGGRIDKTKDNSQRTRVNTPIRNPQSAIRNPSMWSLKRLHRAILLSAAYRQQSNDRPNCRAKDPTNRLLWRMHRRRLDFEAMRDSLLAVSGGLDQRIGGKPVNLLGKGFITRRTIYGFVDRMNLPNLHRSFDFPSPAATSPKRETTTIPPQALYLMNHDFVWETARRAAARTKSGSNDSDITPRLRRLYAKLFNRRPTSEENQIAAQFLGEKPSEAAWTRFAHALLLTNEFVFVD